jgi:DNA processing protein
MGREHWLRLALTTGIGPILIRRLIDKAGSAEAACTASTSLLQSIEGIGSGAKASAIRASMQAVDVVSELARCEKIGVDIISPDDAVFPTLLTQIPDPPAVLYVKGTIEPRDLNSIAIVGSRKCSYYGREQSERFAALLAGAGFTVVSGGARGIDSAAHRGALSHPQGRTIAVLGSGIDVPYPPENVDLLQMISARGAVMSEYPLGTPPVRENFPRRNRIVSGLSRGVLVIEADERSGALITARQACDDHGRTVFAVPGRVDQSTSAGPHKLIRDGAVLTTCIEDILENLDPLPQAAMENSLFEAVASMKPQAKVAEKLPISLSERQQLIFTHLGVDPLNVDGLIERTALTAQDVLQELTLMSLKGIIRRVDGQSYVRAGAPS